METQPKLLPTMPLTFTDKHFRDLLNLYFVPNRNELVEHIVDMAISQSKEAKAIFDERAKKENRKVKNVKFKVWTAIEEIRTLEDGNEIYVDNNNVEPNSAGTFLTIEEAVERTEEIGKQFELTGSADNVKVG